MYFCFNDTATTEIYTLSLRDALPISRPPVTDPGGPADGGFPARDADPAQPSVTYGLAATSVPSASSLIRKSSNTLPATRCSSRRQAMASSRKIGRAHV